MKKNDYILISILLGICVILFTYIKSTHHSGSTVIITCDENTVGTYPLNIDNTINIPYYDGGYNTIIIYDGTVCVSEADCPDKTCTNHPSISMSGESIVCLPHKLVVKILD